MLGREYSGFAIEQGMCVRLGRTQIVNFSWDSISFYGSQSHGSGYDTQG